MTDLINDKAKVLNDIADRGINIAQFIAIYPEDKLNSRYEHINTSISSSSKCNNDDSIKQNYDNIKRNDYDSVKQNDDNIKRNDDDSIKHNNKLSVKYKNEDSIKYKNEDSVKYKISELINNSTSRMVNIRTYTKHKTKGNEFIMGKGINDLDEIINIINKNSDNNIITIVSENINPCDGGVSGVVIGNTIEFSPDSTPRCVEKDGICKMPFDMGKYILNKVYGTKLDLYHIDRSKNRIEFSLHPNKVGKYNKRTTIWEVEPIKQKQQDIRENIRLPINSNFSKLLGEKVYGLLVAEYLGMNIPMTTVYNHRLNTFTIGKPTGYNSVWTRTAPVQKEAGKYETVNCEVNPNLFFNMYNKQKTVIPSVLQQQGVYPFWSGSAIINKDSVIIEGVKGKGDDFQQGTQDKHDLESIDKIKYSTVEDKIKSLQRHTSVLDNFQIEWVFDRYNLWVVQLNQIEDFNIDNENNESNEYTYIVKGNVLEYIDFEANLGLERLRDVVKNISKTQGINIIGNVGITSHIGDILRNNNIVSRITKY